MPQEYGQGKMTIHSTRCQNGMQPGEFNPCTRTYECARETPYSIPLYMMASNTQKIPHICNQDICMHLNRPIVWCFCLLLTTIKHAIDM